MESKFYEEDKLLIFKITDEIDDFSVQKIRRRADYEIERYMPKKVIFNFNSVNFMDSAGIGLLLGRYKIINMLGGEVSLINVKRSVKKILDMSGISKLIHIYDDLEMKFNIG
mgnify:CR=1 FL=1